MIAITGTGVVTPMGDELTPLIDRLCAGANALDDAAAAPWGGAPEPRVLRIADSASGLEGLVPARQRRRIGRLSRLMIVAVHRALAAAGILAGPDHGVVCGTGLGALDETTEFLEQVARDGALGASPSLFPASVMSAAAGQVSMHLGLLGFNATICHGAVSGELALIAAAEALAAGRARALIAGSGDELSRAAHEGFRAAGRLAPRGVARPYGVGAEGVVLGEGACALTLEREDDARGRGVPVLARLRGFAAGGLREDARGEVIARCLAAASTKPAAVGLIIGSGCGAPDQDAEELAALHAVFGDRLPPLTSPHGALGWYPASGALRAALAVGVLNAGISFPTLTRDADPRAAGALISGSPRRGRVDSVLVVGHAPLAPAVGDRATVRGTGAALLIVRG